MSLDPLGKAGAANNALPPTTPKTGFASQPSEHQELPLDIHDLLVKHPHAVFYFRAAGPAFDEIHIYDDDILVIDTAEAITAGRLVVAVDTDEFIVRWVEKRDGTWFLVTDDENDTPIPILEPGSVFGVVTHVIHAVARRTKKGEADETRGSR